MDEKVSALSGGLLGMAVGDAMGYPVDRKIWDEIAQMYGPNGLLGYDLANGNAEITSYTQLATFVCNGLLLGAIRQNPEKYGRYILLSLREWAKSQQPRINPEKTFCWVAQVPTMRRRLCMDTRMLDALTRDVVGTPEKPVFRSVFPGALSAAAAVGLSGLSCKLTRDAVARLGMEAVAVTHGEPEAFLSGAFAALAVDGVLRTPGMPLTELYEQLCLYIEETYAQVYPEAVQGLTAGVRQALVLTRDAELSPLAAMTLLGCATAAECVAGMVYASAVHPANFDEAMIVSVNHSGRSSCVAALTGAVLGARLGKDALPEFYLESLESTWVMEELATDMTQVRQVSKIFDDSWDHKYVQGLPTR
ncbi:MAG: ADP-ribosylglycohydrolase family protein [Oscillospiraceae bacterium]|nr:ADP-ribosylglycohydrolase family protein [Oscillospiraceae bacterium]